MPYDAFTLKAEIKELNNLLREGKINKVLQPDKDEIVLLVYTGKTSLRLLFSAGPTNPRIHITENVKENLKTPYPFCMSLRKYITGGTIKSFEQLPYDRIVTVNIENTSEMLDKTQFRLIIEIMARQSNIILTNEKNKILTLQKSVSADSSRPMLCGMQYSYPLSAKIKISDIDGLNNLLKNNSGCFDAAYLSANIMGLSKETARHIICRCENSGGINAENIIKALNEFDENINKGIYQPCIKTEEASRDFYIFPYCGINSATLKFYDSVNKCLDAYYSTAETDRNLEAKRRNLAASVNAALKKIEKKKAILTKQLAECENAEYYRKCGELITANIYKIKQPQKSVTVSDYYEDGRETTITLDEKLSPSKNAQAYYKKYNKLKSALLEITPFLKEARKQSEYLLSLADYIKNAKDICELDEIFQELEGQGIIKKQNEKQPEKNKKSEPHIYKIEESGCVIYCGKNNIQNDYITFKLAKPDDLWFHIKGEHGPHVLLKTDKNEIDENAILAAARIASSFSKSDKTAVDYTQKKHVKKPAGAKPGFVVYTDFKTIIVNKATIQN
jgi:predicted ribosome quality control (RQC) complex YloA/Tae2 family protein